MWVRPRQVALITKQEKPTVIVPEKPDNSLAAIGATTVEVEQCLPSKILGQTRMPNGRFPPIADTGTGVNCLPRMNIEPDSDGKQPAITPVEVAAYLITALCIIFTINIVLDWLGGKLGTGIMDVGRRHDLGFVLSLFLGLYLTHKVAAWAGFRQRRKH